MPLAFADAETVRLEERVLRESIMSSHEKSEPALRDEYDDFDVHTTTNASNLAMDKALLQLIQIACKSDKTQRAMELTAALHSPKSVAAAVKIASHFQLVTLAERMQQVAEVSSVIVL